MKVNIGPYKDEGERKVEVHIHDYDTWSMDHTLALIIHPMLIQLKETKHGAPAVELKDVPEELWPPNPEQAAKLYAHNGETDDNYFKRWDYILDEMIWAFEQLTLDDDTDPFYDHSKRDKNDHSLASINKIKIDYEGLKAHNERKSRALTMFGKYYQSLWD